MSRDVEAGANRLLNVRKSAMGFQEPQITTQVIVLSSTAVESA